METIKHLSFGLVVLLVLAVSMLLVGSSWNIGTWLVWLAFLGCIIYATFEVSKVIDPTESKMKMVQRNSLFIAIGGLVFLAMGVIMVMMSGDRIYGIYAYIGFTLMFWGMFLGQFLRHLQRRNNDHKLWSYSFDFLCLWSALLLTLLPFERLEEISNFLGFLSPAICIWFGILAVWYAVRWVYRKCTRKKVSS